MFTPDTYTTNQPGSSTHRTRGTHQRPRCLRRTSPWGPGSRSASCARRQRRPPPPARGSRQGAQRCGIGEVVRRREGRTAQTEL
eukprot:scaffold219253_cov16-Tisochrysis_lutea.AAC.2